MCQTSAETHSEEKQTMLSAMVVFLVLKRHLQSTTNIHTNGVHSILVTNLVLC